MPTMRITKRYNNLSPLNGMLVNDKIEFNTREDGAAFVRAVAANDELDWELVDYEWAIVLLNPSS